jgi:O-acetyl-ADP-ribose deacetylase (regulator of RNase III)
MISFGKKPVEIHFIVDDITMQNVDAIVNAANSHLSHGGGVAGVISRRGGPEIQKESDEYVKKHGPVPPGGVAVTSAGSLPAKYIIHAVGPIGDKLENDEIMKKCITNIIEKADELGVKNIALPFVGTGIFGYPFERFAHVVIETLIDYLKDYNGPIEKIIFCDVDAGKVKKFEEYFFEKLS